MKKIELVAKDTIVMGENGKDTVPAGKSFSVDETTALRLMACGAAVPANPDALKPEQGALDAAGSVADAEAQALLETAHNAARDAKIESNREKAKAKTKAQAKAAAEAKARAEAAAKAEADDKARQEADDKARADEEERQSEQGSAGTGGGIGPGPGTQDLLSGTDDTQ